MFLQHEIGKMIKPNIWLQENQFNVVNFFFAVHTSTIEARMAAFRIGYSFVQEPVNQKLS